MELTVIGTGSSGNCYLLKDSDGQVLVLDAGMPIMDVKKALNFNVSSIVGVTATHGHTDHCKSVKDFELMGITVFKPYEENLIRANIQFGNFYITAFTVNHDETPCYGFLIDNKGERLLYITDFEYCRYTFGKCKVKHFIVECNYQEKYLDMESASYSHKVKGHSELKTCKKFLEVNHTPYMKNVLLVHYGIGTCDVEECVEEISNALNDDVKVDYARKGETYKL